MSAVFRLSLDALQPSQLYISRAKLARVRGWWRPPRAKTLPPLPVRRLHGRIIYTDGHTRAFAAYRAGVEAVPVVWDEDELDWDAYQICVDWCRAAGIHTIKDLEGRVIAPEAYKRLWLERCAAMQAALEKARRKGGEDYSGIS